MSLEQPSYIFLGMWGDYKIDEFLHKLLLPSHIPNWREVSLGSYLKYRTKVDLIICSSFNCLKTYGYLKRYARQLANIPKLLLNGENPNNFSRQHYLLPCIKFMDYVIDFRRHTRCTNPEIPINLQSIHFPVWLWFNPDGLQWTPDNNPVARINKGWQRPQGDKFLASCVASHDTNNTRLPIIREVQKYGHVACPGKLISNYPPITKGYDAKINFIAQGRYNICTENSSGTGYFTEKIYNALEAGCTPIYWCGNGERPLWVNPNVYIHLQDLAPETISSQLSGITTMVRSTEPPLTPTAGWEIADCFYQLQFLFRDPVILKLPQPPTIHLSTAAQVLAVCGDYPLGTQFTWGTDSNLPQSWKYLNWQGLHLDSNGNTNTTVTTINTNTINTDTNLINPQTLIQKILASQSGILHKNYFTRYLIETTKIRNT